MESNVVLWLKSLCNILISTTDDSDTSSFVGTMKADPGCGHGGGGGGGNGVNQKMVKQCDEVLSKKSKLLSATKLVADSNNNNDGCVNNINCDYRVDNKCTVRMLPQSSPPQQQSPTTTPILLPLQSNHQSTTTASQHRSIDSHSDRHGNHSPALQTSAVQFVVDCDCDLDDCGGGDDKLVKDTAVLVNTMYHANSGFHSCSDESANSRTIDDIHPANNRRHIPAQMVDSTTVNRDSSSADSSSLTSSKSSSPKLSDSRCDTPSTALCNDSSRQSGTSTPSTPTTVDVIDLNCGNDDACQPEQPNMSYDDACCDIIDYKNRLCQQLLLSASPQNRDLKSGQTFKSSKIIESIIEMIKSEQLCARFEPYITKKKHNFEINPMTTISMNGCTIKGFSNVEKTDNDCIVRYLGNNRFSIDCIIQIHNLMCDANYAIKFGKKWHKRICLRDKTLCLKLERCLIYIEVMINTDSKSIRFERFSPISQQQICCKAKAFSFLSANNLFSRLLQSYFERYFAANVLLLESYARRRLDRSSVLNYDDVVTNTALLKLFGCFESANKNSDDQNKCQNGQRLVLQKQLQFPPVPSQVTCTAV